MAFFAAAAMAETAATWLGAASMGASAYQFFTEREKAKANATLIAKQTGELLKDRLNKRVLKLPNDNIVNIWNLVNIWNSKIDDVVCNMRTGLSKPRNKIEQLNLTFPLKNFINVNKKIIDSAFDAYNTVLRQKREELENSLNDAIMNTISKIVAKKERDFNRVKEWRKEATENTLTFEGDNYVATTSVYCIELLRKYYSQHGDAFYRDKLSILRQKINTEFTNLSNSAAKEHTCLIRLIEDKVVAHVETVELVRTILANIEYALGNTRRTFLLNMVMCEPGM
jgi:hypothetical protein